MVVVAVAGDSHGCTLTSVESMLHAVAPEQSAVELAVELSIAQFHVALYSALAFFRRCNAIGRPLVPQLLFALSIVSSRLATTIEPEPTACRIAFASKNKRPRVLPDCCKRTIVSPPWF